MTDFLPRRCRAPAASAALVALTFGSAPLQAQSPARIEGSVRDQTGSALVGVTIGSHTPAGVDRSTTTDPTGDFALDDLAAGHYQVDFRLPGFATSVRTVDVADGAVVRLDVVLRLALTADVLVTGSRTFRTLTDLDEPVNGLLGLASAGSEGVVSAKSIEERPVYRAGEIFETIPGVVISQHSGEGKANQYYARGFNLDHGTDLATWVAGAPVNMPTHAHGQGYSDNNFLIPELVSGVQYRMGTYSAEQGDFSSAGSVNVNYSSVLDHGLLKAEGGQDGYGRLLGAASPKLGSGFLLCAGELYHNDGPWVHPDGFRRLNGVLRFSQGDQQNGFSLTAMAYSGRWDSTD